jgi:uncharacterized membrane protein
MQWTDIVGLAVGVVTILAALLAGIIWLVRAIVRQELEKYTKTIQPGYRNGGASLADISAKLDDLASRL